MNKKQNSNTFSKRHYFSKITYFPAGPEYLAEPRPRIG